MTDTNLSPAEFVRKMSTATPEAVVAAAKKAGFKLDTTYVSKTRGLDKARAARWGKARPAASTKKGAGKKTKTKPKPAKAVAAKAPTKSVSTTAKGGGSKADFIRGMAGATTAEVVAAAKKAGINTNDSYVKWLRWSDGRKKGKPAKASKAPKAAKSAKPKAAKAAKTVAFRIAPKHVGTASKASQHAFVTSAFDLGLARAAELLEGLRSRVRSIAV